MISSIILSGIKTAQRLCNRANYKYESKGFDFNSNILRQCGEEIKVYQ